MDISERMRAIARLPRKPQTLEHRAAISRGVLRARAEGRHREDATGEVSLLSPEEFRYYVKLRHRNGMSREEALRAITGATNSE